MKAIRMIAFTVAVAIAGGVLTGCYVEERRPYWAYHHHHYDRW